MAKLKVFLILIALFVTGAIMTACGSGVFDDSRLREEGFVCVTIDTLGGKIGEAEVKFLYLKPSDPLIEPGVSTPSLPAPRKTGYYYEGLAFGEKDENGNVTLNERWDFTTDRVPEHDITLYAVWDESYYFDFVYGDNFSESHIVYVPKVNIGTDCQSIPKAPEGLTFAECFENADFSGEALEFPLNHKRQTKSQKIYTKALEGDYTLVSSVNDLLSIFVTTNYYLLKDIDFTDAEWSFPDGYRGIFDGNNKTIRNIDAKIVQSRGDSYYGLFGIVNSATIKNLAFADCTLELDVGVADPQGTYVGFVAGSLTNTTLSGLSFSYCELKIINSFNNQDYMDFVTDYGKLYGYNGGSNTGVEGINTDGITLSPAKST